MGTQLKCVSKIIGKIRKQCTVKCDPILPLHRRHLGHSRSSVTVPSKALREGVKVLPRGGRSYRQAIRSFFQ